MEACIRQTDLPHTSRLFADYLYDFERVAPFYAHSPHDFRSFHDAAARVQFPNERRAGLVQALREENGDSPLLETLTRPGTVAVVTGQQVGLFSGPCYTVYKAITAVCLARELSQNGVPAVPVFWLATEDHDFAEINHAWVFDELIRPVRLEMTGSDGLGSPVGGVSAGGAPLAALQAALAGFPFAEDVLAAVERAYEPGATVGSAFEKLLKELLGSQQMLFIDPMRPAFRRLAAPVLRDAVRRMPELTARIIERSRALEQAGYHAQVLVEQQTSLVFLLEEGRRLALRREGAEFAANGRYYSAQQLMDRAADLSPNALLRPVVQDSMLPTVAYVGGPAEVAYLAQSAVLYQDLIGRQPVAVPRQSATLLDARAVKLMERYHLRLGTVLRGGAREAISARLVPPEIEAALVTASKKMDAVLEELAAPLAQFDPTLGEAFARSRRKMAYQMQKTERKAAREALRRNQRAQAEAEYLENLLYPEKHLQERLYSIIPFVARHGRDLIDRLAAEFTAACPDHRLIAL